MNRREIKHLTNTVRVRGILSKHDGQVTPAEVADALDLDAGIVRYIIKQRGWKCLSGNRERDEYASGPRELRF